MNKKELIKKIISKKEFSELPESDVKLVFDRFDKKELIDEEKIKLSRDLLRKMYTAFASPKLLNVKNNNEEWFLRKHISTRERFGFYEELYKRLLKNFKGKLNVFDFGAGVNGFSYKFFNKDVNYIGVEAVGQLVNLMNNYFEKNKLNAVAIHESLFELGRIKTLIKKEKGKKIVFLFKTLDSLEMLKRDYSKKFLLGIMPLVDEVVVSFATRSLISKKKFNVRRNWIVNFIKDNFSVLEDFESGGERYISFRNAPH